MHCQEKLKVRPIHVELDSPLVVTRQRHLDGRPCEIETAVPHVDHNVEWLASYKIIHNESESWWRMHARISKMQWRSRAKSTMKESSLQWSKG